MDNHTKQEDCLTLPKHTYKIFIKVLTKLLIEMGCNSPRCQTITNMVLFQSGPQFKIQITTEEAAHKLFREKLIEEDLEFSKTNKKHYSKTNRETLRRFESVNDFQKLRGLKIWIHEKIQRGKNKSLGHKFTFIIIQYVDSILAQLPQKPSEKQINQKCKDYADLLKKYATPISPDQLKKEHQEEALKNLKKRVDYMKKSLIIESKEEWFEFNEKLSFLESGVEDVRQRLKEVWLEKFEEEEEEEEELYTRTEEEVLEEELLTLKFLKKEKSCDPLMDHRKEEIKDDIPKNLETKTLKKDRLMISNFSINSLKGKLGSQRGMVRTSECRKCGKSRCLENDYVVYCFREAKAFNIEQLEKGNFNSSKGSKKRKDQKELLFEGKTENPYNWDL